MPRGWRTSGSGAPPPPLPRSAGSSTQSPLVRAAVVLTSIYLPKCHSASLVCKDTSMCVTRVLDMRFNCGWMEACSTGSE